MNTGIPVSIGLLTTGLTWSPLTKPLSEATVALVSTCGLYRGDVHVPFAAWHDFGDPSYRVICDDTPPERLRIADAHYDHHHVAADHEVAFPVIHFHQLAKRGVVGSVIRGCLVSWVICPNRAS